MAGGSARDRWDCLRSGAPWAILAAVVILLLWASASPNVAWVHPELLGTSVYVWNDPGAGLASMLRKVFDWKAFDPNVNRVRPLNDAVEVVDAVARPYLVQIFHAVLAPLPSTLLLITAVPIGFYAWSRRVLRACWPALLITLLLMSTVAFLSLALAYIRPAKRLDMVLMVGVIYFLERSREASGNRDFWIGYALCLASFFADELGLANWALLSVLYRRESWRRDTARALAVSLLPLLFLGMSQWALPFIYQNFSVHGPWNALGDERKWAVFGYLLDPRFYQAAAVGLGRSVLSCLGVARQDVPLVWVAAAAVLLMPFAAWLYQRSAQALDWCLSGVLVAAFSAYATLLDWYPFPFEVNYLGSYNYYYHSPVAVLVACWLVFGWRLFRDRVHPSPPAVGALVAGLVLAASLSNALMFPPLNRMVRAIHYYPYQAPRVAAALQRAGFSEDDAVCFSKNPKGVTKDFHTAQDAVILGSARPDGFAPILEMVERTPILTTYHLAHMARSFFPWRQLSIEFGETGTPPPRSGVCRQ